MHTRWLESLVITLGLGTLGIVGCKGDDEGGSDTVGDGDSPTGSESGSSTQTTGVDTSTSTTSDTSCIPGEQGCSCNGGLCLGDLVCENDLCTDPNCIPGELACECNMGLCLGDLVCVGGVCLEDGGTTTDTTSTTTSMDTTTDTGMECPNPNEMMCDGICVDVVENLEDCGSCGVTCEVSVDMTVGGCSDSQCKPYWSECFQQSDGFTTCEQACQAEGKVCMEDSCGGYTWIESNSNGLCLSGNTDGTLHGAPPCDFPIVWQAATARCCCL